MRPLIAWARRNPAIIIGVSALVGWAIGSGLVPLSLPFPTAAAPPATAPATGAPPAPAASFATSSASMPASSPPPDPFGGYGI
jgi:hypothetical protein